jgi:predicted transcriptional regulator
MCSSLRHAECGKEQHVLDERRKPLKSSEPDISVFRPDRPGIRKVLGDLEAEIMELVWSRPPGQGTIVRDVFDILYERREKRIAYTTVMNTMSRLAKKHLLRVEKKDQAYVYYPNMTQEAFVSGFVGRILEDLLVNFSGASLEHLHTLPNSPATAQARQYLDQITCRRQEEEEA